MEVVYCPEAREELKALPSRERQAMLHAVEKLEALGDRLPYPHSSLVRGESGGLRELRPRGGASVWRAFYRRVQDVLVIGAIGPEAKHNPHGFQRAVEAAQLRIAHFERGDDA